VSRGAADQHAFSVHQTAPREFLAIGIPSFGMVHLFFTARLLNLRIPMNTTIRWFYVIGKEVGDARNEIVARALEADGSDMRCKAVFFLDDDVLFHPDVLKRLLSHRRPIVSGLYYTKTAEPTPLALHDEGHGTAYDWTPGEVIDVAGHGMGLTLIDADVFRRLRDEQDLGVDAVRLPALVPHDARRAADAAGTSRRASTTRPRTCTSSRARGRSAISPPSTPPRPRSPGTSTRSAASATRWRSGRNGHRPGGSPGRRRRVRSSGRGAYEPTARHGDLDLLELSHAAEAQGREVPLLPRRRAPRVIAIASKSVSLDDVRSSVRTLQDRHAPMLDAFHSLSYHSYTWSMTTWMGVPLLKHPCDLFALQEIVASIRPALIIETGTAFGGSALYLAHLCDLLGHGQVLTIDLEPAPSLPRIRA
jgi:hypothetical protein